MTKTNQKLEKTKTISNSTHTQQWDRDHTRAHTKKRSTSLFYGVEIAKLLLLKCHILFDLYQKLIWQWWLYSAYASGG